MDVVAELNAGKITADEAEDRFSDLIRSWSGEPTDEVGFLRHVGMSRHEYTAFMHGASVEDLAELRVKGWPETCSSCGHPIDYGVGLWFHPPESVASKAWVGCVECAGHPSQDVIPWVSE